MTDIKIQQVPTNEAPTRKFLLGFNFCNTYEASSSWRDLTNSGKLILPKKLYFRDQNNVLHPLNGTNVNIGGFDNNNPLVMRGDKVSIRAGYRYFDSTNHNRETDLMSNIFNGYVSRVIAAQPLEIELEDSMWLFKQTPIDTKEFPSSTTLEDIMNFLVGKVNDKWQTNFSVNALTSTGFGNFRIGNESAAQVLSILQKKYGFEFYFKSILNKDGSVNRIELRGGVIIYVPGEGIQHDFIFQNNIIEDDLQYVRKDDVKLSAIARNTILVDTGKLTKDGKEKTKRKRLEVLVELINNPRPDSLPYKFTEIKSGDFVPENDEGERRTFYFGGANTINELADLAFNKLKLYYYTGLRGSFTTFGQPFVQQGDNANIFDPIMPERSGLFKIRKVEYSGGVKGLRQKITLDFKLN